MERSRHRCPVPDLGLSYDITLSNVSVLYDSATPAQDTSVLLNHSNPKATLLASLILPA